MLTYAMLEYLAIDSDNELKTVYVRKVIQEEYRIGFNFTKEELITAQVLDGYNAIE
jgi:hypothetical protein